MTGSWRKKMARLEGTLGMGPTLAIRALRRQLQTSWEVAGTGRGGRRKFRLKRATGKDVAASRDREAGAGRGLGKPWSPVSGNSRTGKTTSCGEDRQTDGVPGKVLAMGQVGWGGDHSPSVARAEAAAGQRESPGRQQSFSKPKTILNFLL